MTNKQLHDPRTWRALASAAVFAFVFAFAFGAIAGPLPKPPVILCPAGFYCEPEVRQPCLEAGHYAALCDGMWRTCVIDACQ